VDESAGRSLTIIRSAVVTHPPFAVLQGTNALEQISFPALRRRAPNKKSARLTRGNISAGIWRYCVVIGANMTTHLLKKFVSDTVPNMKPIHSDRKSRITVLPSTRRMSRLQKSDGFA
jgi:hypothetical protein